MCSLFWTIDTEYSAKIDCKLRSSGAASFGIHRSCCSELRTAACRRTGHWSKWLQRRRDVCGQPGGRATAGPRPSATIRALSGTCGDAGGLGGGGACRRGRRGVRVVAVRPLWSSTWRRRDHRASVTESRRLRPPDDSSRLLMYAVDHFSAFPPRQTEQVAQLSQRDRAAGWVSYGQKWKTGTGRQYLRTI